MSVVVYRGISLEIVNTREHRREIVNSPDGTTYLWTKWTFDFDCRYHIRATSYTEFPVAGSPLGAVAAIPGRSPFQTDTVLRKYLSQHRGVLRVDTGGGRLLTSPATGFGLDANNGPIVEACNVERVLGDKQFLVRLRITTCINECDRNVTAAANPDYTNINPVVSHRWSRREDVDQVNDQAHHPGFAEVLSAGVCSRLGKPKQQPREADQSGNRHRLRKNRRPSG